MTALPPGPPATQLPPIAKIKQSSPADLRAALGYLGSLYNPEVRPNRLSYRRSGTGECASTWPTSHDTATRRRGASDAAQTLPSLHLNAIRADGFERSYAIQWLTTLVSCADQLNMDDVAAEQLLQDAAGLLAICAGTASAGTRSRMFVFGDQPGGRTADVRVPLTDLPLDNQDYTSVGAQTWGGACLMADMIVQAPLDFGIQVISGRPLRILELGAGTGLVGLAVGKMLVAQGASTEIVATDFHPAILKNLRNNAAANFSDDDSSAVSMSVHPLDWSKFAESSPPPLAAPFDRPFDIVLGADIIYELEHAKWIKCTVEALLRTPPVETVEALTSPSGPQPHPQFHLVIPLRATHAAESRSVEEVFPLASEVRGGTESPPEGEPVQRTLGIVAKEVVACEDLARGGGSEVEYVHYTFAWI